MALEKDELLLSLSAGIRLLGQAWLIRI